MSQPPKCSAHVSVIAAVALFCLALLAFCQIRHVAWETKYVAWRTDNDKWRLLPVQRWRFAVGDNAGYWHSRHNRGGRIYQYGFFQRSTNTQ